MGAAALAGSEPPAQSLRQLRWVAAAMLLGGILMTPRLFFTEAQARSSQAPVTIPVAPQVVLVPEVSLPRESPEGLGKVWLVEKQGTQEIYSNGLRIETEASMENVRREPAAFDRKTLKREEAGITGIVFHTTESHIAPFDPGNNGELKSAGRYLLDYVRRERCYNYLIDRFGRVHRVVREEDVAWHSGDSAWGDDKRLYVNLNHGFLGVAFETRTEQGNTAPASVTSAQVHAARVLTGMLRAKYGIDGLNCVTHAQVSLNTAYFLIGLHTDWAANFPYAEIGLPDNYGRIYASITDFGFSYDDSFVRATGTRMLTGLSLSEDRLRRDAASKGMSLEAHRAKLRQLYRTTIAGHCCPK